MTDDATGEIAACGVWVYLPEGYCAEDDDEVALTGPLPEGANEELMGEFGRMTGKIRGEHAGRKEGHWCECFYVFLSKSMRDLCTSLADRALSFLGGY